jgi:hypothetical protein
VTPKQLATAKILAGLRSPMSLMSRPFRLDLEALAKEHEITALDLLALANERAKNT